MSPRVAFVWLLAINLLLAVGDYFSKRAVASSERDTTSTALALALWVVGCCMWLPVMRARGFTKLVALADVIGLLMLVAVGYFFLDERLTAREASGVACACLAVGLLA